MRLAAVGRLLEHRDGPAAWNMSVDQAVLESTSSGQHRSAATLRIYSWQRPTLSLGYFQNHVDSDSRFTHLDRVRRSTGGGAILHHHELTYGLVLPTAHSERGARTDLYRLVHQAIIAVLRSFAVHAVAYREQQYHEQWRAEREQPGGESAFLCFSRRTDEDLTVGGYKVLGSAQRRARGAILQHGSLLLRASEHASELPGIRELTSRDLSFDSLVRPLAREIGGRLDVDFENSDLDAGENARAEQIADDRFNSQHWWLRR